MMFNEHERHHKKTKNKKYNSPPFSISALFLFRGPPKTGFTAVTIELGIDRLVD